jgi:hypothetical protein
MSGDMFAQNVYEFQMEVFAQLLTKFEGKVIGSDDCNLDSLKDEFFKGYTPGDKAKGVKVKNVKKPRPLSGYIFFGQQNKEEFNKEMAEEVRLVKEATEKRAQDVIAAEKAFVAAKASGDQAKVAEANAVLEKELPLPNKPSRFTFISKKWKILSDEEQGNWSEKAKAYFEESQKEQKEQTD